MAMSPVGFVTEDDFAGEVQQKFNSQAVRTAGLQLCELLL
jgi:hypothetical protein